MTDPSPAHASPADTSAADISALALDPDAPFIRLNTRANLWGDTSTNPRHLLTHCADLHDEALTALLSAETAPEADNDLALRLAQRPNLSAAHTADLLRAHPHLAGAVVNDNTDPASISEALRTLHGPALLHALAPTLERTDQQHLKICTAALDSAPERPRHEQALLHATVLSQPPLPAPLRNHALAELDRALAHIDPIVADAILIALSHGSPLIHHERATASNPLLTYGPAELTQLTHPALLLALAPHLAHPQAADRQLLGNAAAALSTAQATLIAAHHEHLQVASRTLRAALNAVPDLSDDESEQFPRSPLRRLTQQTMRQLDPCCRDALAAARLCSALTQLAERYDADTPAASSSRRALTTLTSDASWHSEVAAGLTLTDLLLNAPSHHARSDTRTVVALWPAVLTEPVQHPISPAAHTAVIRELVGALTAVTRSNAPDPQAIHDAALTLAAELLRTRPALGRMSADEHDDARQLFALLKRTHDYAHAAHSVGVTLTPDQSPTFSTLTAVLLSHQVPLGRAHQELPALHQLATAPALSGQVSRSALPPYELAMLDALLVAHQDALTAGLSPDDAALAAGLLVREAATSAAGDAPQPVSADGLNAHGWPDRWNRTPTATLRQLPPAVPTYLAPRLPVRALTHPRVRSPELLLLLSSILGVGEQRRSSSAWDALLTALILSGPETPGSALVTAE